MATATNPSPLHDLNAFQRDALAAIAGLTTPCGLDVKRKLDAAYGEKIGHGRLYPGLDALVEKGLVEKGEYDRRTNKYKLTSRGRRELKAHQAWAEQAISGEV